MEDADEEKVREALALAVHARADLAAELFASLDEGSEDPADVEAAWAAEIAKRARRVRDSEFVSPTSGISRGAIVL